MKKQRSYLFQMGCGWPPLAHLKLLKLHTCQGHALSCGSSEIYTI